MSTVKAGNDGRLLPQGTSAALLAVLVCPVDKCDLELVQEMLVCTSCGREYPIEDGIPDMLVRPERID